MRRLAHLARTACVMAAMASPGAAAGAPDPAAHGVALIELYTSEGCSSCPPADVLLERFAADAQRTGRRVYGLSFHVDYWDHLGWKDRFSNAAYSRRQGLYARRFGIGSLYTPQMIVNGEEEFVGSDARKADAAIGAALSHAEQLTPRITVAAKGRDVAVTWSTAGAPHGAVLNVAWADARADSKPSRGENDGRALHHVNIVRDLRSVDLDGGVAGTLHLSRPEIKDGAVVAWIQADATGPVLGAASVPVSAR